MGQLAAQTDYLQAQTFNMEFGLQVRCPPFEFLHVKSQLHAILKNLKRQ